MLKLPKNNPDDEEFIKKSHQNPEWPDDIDRPTDWDRVGLLEKIWFKVGGGIKAAASAIIMLALATSCMIALEASDSPMEEPLCDPAPNGCYEH